MTEDLLTTVYFIRHAESDISVPEDRARPLTAKGLADSARLAEWFRDIQIDHIYSSPYLRAWQTVSDLAALKGLDVQPEENFRERQNCGFEPSFMDHLRWLWEDFNHCKAGEESMRQVQNRNIAALNKLLESFGGDNHYRNTRHCLVDDNQLFRPWVRPGGFYAYQKCHAVGGQSRV